MSSIGIRREDKHEWEARVPVTPDGVRNLVAQGVRVVIQPSTIRVFSDKEYEVAGAELAEDLSDVNAVLAVKEVPMDLLRQGGAYVFFSHTIKGQTQNMPLLRRLMSLGCTLIDYERIVDDRGRRLVFFGRHAGLAGMIDTLAVLGRRLTARGIDSVFSQVKLAYEYEDLDAAREAIRKIGQQLVVPDQLAPFVCGFAGYGNVSQGAQAIYDLLPVEEISPSELAAVPPRTDRVFKVIFKEEHLAERSDGSAFVLQDYYDHPENYRSIFEQHLPHLSVLVNAIYWTKKYPRLLRNAYLKEHGAGRLLVVGDISCDIEGSVECTVKATTPGLPAYVVDPASGEVTDGWEAAGLVMMTTDCLPCELPRESSASFTTALTPFVPPIAALTDEGSFDEAGLPPEIAKATILWRGELTPDFEYMRAYL
jgi:alanine dehydrogenase